MCGIFLCEQDDFEIIKLIKNRGLDYFGKVQYNGFTLCSSVLSIRDQCEQPVVTEKFAFLYNGEIYNGEQSDTIWIKDTLNTIAVPLLSESIIDYAAIAQKIYKEINKYENELALVVILKDVVILFKDDIGRKSLGFNNDKLLISSIGYTNEIDNLFIYIYDLRSRRFDKVMKDCYFSYFYLNKHSALLPLIRERPEYNFLMYQNEEFTTCNNKIQHLVSNTRDILNAAISKRMIEGNLVVLFSGGLDSNLIALLLLLNSKPTQKLVLINASFKNSLDRKNAIESHKTFKSKFCDRGIQLVIVNLDIKEIKNRKEYIYRVIHPKTSKMDFNIGVILYFASQEASKHSKICYTGSGADEVFCGYKKYKGDDFRDIMIFDLFTISYHNTTRDDRCISDNNIEARFPFLDTNVIKHSFTLSNDEIRNKRVLRDLLSSYGFEELANLKKTAMQFGSGLYKIEKQI